MPIQEGKLMDNQTEKKKIHASCENKDFRYLIMLCDPHISPLKLTYDSPSFISGRTLHSEISSRTCYIRLSF